MLLPQSRSWRAQFIKMLRPSSFRRTHDCWYFSWRRLRGYIIELYIDSHLIPVLLLSLRASSHMFLLTIALELFRGVIFFFQHQSRSLRDSIGIISFRAPSTVHLFDQLLKCSTFCRHFSTPTFLLPSGYTSIPAGSLLCLFFRLAFIAQILTGGVVIRYFSVLLLQWLIYISRLQHDLSHRVTWLQFPIIYRVSLFPYFWKKDWCWNSISCLCDCDRAESYEAGRSWVLLFSANSRSCCSSSLYFNQCHLREGKTTSLLSSCCWAPWTFSWWWDISQK